MNFYELKLIFQSRLPLSLLYEEYKSDYIATLMNSLMDLKKNNISQKGLISVYRQLITKPMEEGIPSTSVLQASHMSLLTVGYYSRVYQLIDYCPGKSGRNTYGGIIYFRNRLIYHSAEILFTDAYYADFIHSIQKLYKS